MVNRKPVGAATTIHHSRSTIHGFPMINSMTGYAAAAREYTHGVLNLELRSVNHRYLDIQFRLPDELRSVEPHLREALAARVGRGKVECRVNFTLTPGTQRTLQLNDALLQELTALGRKISAALPGTAGLAAGDMLR